MTLGHPEKERLRVIAEQCRAFLENEWPLWNAARGRPLGIHASSGSCATSSLFVQNILHTAGGSARVIHGNDPGQPVGLYINGTWHGHSWITCGAFIIDITADQFGLPPVIVTKASDARYHAGKIDTASPAAQAQRQALVDQSLGRWAGLTLAQAQSPDHKHQGPIHPVRWV